MKTLERQLRHSNAERWNDKTYKLRIGENMSYLGMSVKEAVNNVSNNVNGWFLPPVQRPYVWGSRYENEKYISKLFDSILRGYPIGGLIVWNNQNPMPYREFIRHYEQGEIENFVDEGLWKRADKWLVYDGQQRLQTLYSCLKYTINNRVLAFDLSFIMNNQGDDPDATGFRFYDKNSELPCTVIKMNELFVKLDNEKTQYRKDVFKKITFDNIDEDNIEKNVDILWDVFVTTNKKTIAYFPVQSPDEETVNEIFQRLNTGGMALSQSDLLLSRIKEKKYDFEEELQLFSKEIYQMTGNGYLFESERILQVLNLLIRGSIKIAADKTQNTDLDQFIQQWTSLKKALTEFFSNFIWESFKINNRSIVPRQQAILPLIIFFKMADEKGINFRKLNNDLLIQLKKYFILSQINDWNLQSSIDRFSKKIIDDNRNSNELVFPMDYFVQYFEENKQRNTVIYQEMFNGYTWFALKILMPHRVFLFEPDSRGRFNPEIDHIFPKKLEAQDNNYYESVDCLWNMQPVKGEVNNFKRRCHPKEFFTTNGEKYFSDYDFVPVITDTEWENWKVFINNRKERMITFLNKTYQIKLTDS